MIHLLDSLKGVKPFGYQEKQISPNATITRAAFTMMKPQKNIELPLLRKMASVPVNVLKRNLRQKIG